MPSLTKKAFFGDYTFRVTEDVYEPAEDSFLFAENLDVKRGCSVLDLGTGCGILGIIAASKALSVVATDINPHAVRCAQENAESNLVSEKMLFVQGDLFSPLRAHKKFDLILFNAPYLPVEHRETDSWLDRAWAGGIVGRQVMDVFIRESPNYLNRDGRILLLHSSLSSFDKTMSCFRDRGLKARVVVERSMPFFESVVLVEAKLQERG